MFLRRPGDNGPFQQLYLLLTDLALSEVRLQEFMSSLSLPRSLIHHNAVHF